MSSRSGPARLPVRPSDLDPDASTPALLDSYLGHLLAMAASRAGRSAPADAAGRAVAALAIGHALIADLSEERWPIVRDALALDVTPAQLTAATGGLQPDELAAGLTAWADRRHVAGLTTDLEHAHVLALIETRLRGLSGPATRNRP